MTDPPEWLKWERLAVRTGEDVANGTGKGHDQFQEVFGSTYYHLYTHRDPAIPFPDIKPRDRSTHIHHSLCTRIFTAAVITVPTNGKDVKKLRHVLKWVLHSKFYWNPHLLKLTKQVNPTDRMRAKKARTKEPTLCGSIYMKLKITEQSQINGSVWGYGLGGDRKEEPSGYWKYSISCSGWSHMHVYKCKNMASCTLTIYIKEIWKDGRVGSTCK